MNSQKMKSLNTSKERILIFGGTGSLGKTLIKRCSSTFDVYCFSRDESKHWTIKNEMPEYNTTFIVGDMRDQSRVDEAIRNVRPKIIIIAGALKHVDTCELSPSESIKTNILGVQNVANSVEEYSHINPDVIQSCIMVSTDKACAPTNVYGMCKALGERVVLSKANVHTNFIATRYGNVLESRGSIIPLFLHQAKNNDVITVTHKDMTRYLMTLDESVDLILDASKFAQHGETWVPKLRAMRIYDLAKIFSERFNKPIKIIGIRPGEKIHEDLISDTEALRTYETKGYYIINPIYKDFDEVTKAVKAQTSKDACISRNELECYLDSLGMFDDPQFVGQSINEIRKSDIKML